MVVSEGLGPFHLAGPLMVMSRNYSNESPVDLRICTVTPGMVRTTIEFDISRAQDLEICDRAQAIIIPGWPGTDAPVPQALEAALLRAHARGAQIVSLCRGVFALASTGLLDGRRATTHWRRTQELAEKFPRIRVEPEVLYVHEDNVWTSAGGAAAIDTCLFLVQALCGAEAAARLSRQLVSFPRREGRWQQVVERPLAEAGTDRRILQTMDFVRANLSMMHSVNDLARRVHVSPRTFSRRFGKIAGTSFSQWLLAQRLGYAKTLLEMPDVSIEKVAQESGFGSPRLLLRHLRSDCDMTPTEYRRSRLEARAEARAETQMSAM